MLFYILYALSLPVGFLLTSYFLRNNKQKFFWYDYIALFILPSVMLYFMYKSAGAVVLAVLFFWIIFGPLLEALVGYTYLFVRGKHLWLYERYPIFNRTTSWLSVPFWAFAGLGIWAANQVITEFFK